MLIIGELINGMYQGVAKAIRERDEGFIRTLARRQVEAGADALDVNCGPASKDAVGDMRWLVETIQKEVLVSLCLDSTKPAVIEEGLKTAKAEAIINSTSADEERLEFFLAMASEHKASLIALMMDKQGMPGDKEKRLELSARIIGFAQEKNFPLERLYLDPVLFPINVAQSQLSDILDVIRDVKILADPAPKTVVGLSNVSQGAKQRGLINRTFLAMAQECGLDAAILDPLDQDVMDSLATSELILNKSIFCDSYLDAFRKSKRA